MLKRILFLALVAFVAANPTTQTSSTEEEHPTESSVSIEEIEIDTELPDDVTTQTPLVMSLKEFLSFEESLVNEDGSVRVIELDPELENENITEGIVEVIQIKPDGEEVINEVKVTDLLMEDDEEDEAEDDDDVETEVDDETDIEDEDPEIEVKSGTIIETPVPLIKNREILVTKDNLVPLIRTVLLASTHKSSPTFKEVMKAGTVSLLKTAFASAGYEKLGSQLIQLTKTFTGILNDDEPNTDDEEELALLAEEYLQDHKFKIVLPESVMLNHDDMADFLKKKLDEASSRALAEEVTEFTFSTGRQAGEVTTLLCKYPILTNFIFYY